MKKIIIVALITLLAFSILSIQETDIVAYVPPPQRVHNIDTGLNYTTIQRAIDAPETLDGHTLVCDAGNYTENVDVDKSLKIIGAGPELTRIGPKPPPETDDPFDCTANNVTIKGFTITSVPYYSGVFLDNVDHSVISNNIFTGNGSGILLKGSNDNSISNNVMHSLPGNGIETRDSSDRNRIMNNILHGNHYGIVVFNGSSHNLISDNFVNSSDWAGIRLNWLGAGFTSVVFNNITNNFVCNNYEGIMLDNPSDINIVHNNMVYDNYIGIRMRQSSKNKIVHNTVVSNSFRGISLESSSGNLIYDNFFNNTNNAWDDGANYWNTTKQTGPNIMSGPYIGGNYWSDNPRPVDADNDGIGDIPYDISGGTNKDNLPLVTGQPIFISTTPKNRLPGVSTISNGTWTREFLNVTHFVTQVPTDATYTIRIMDDGQIIGEFRIVLNLTGRKVTFIEFSTDPQVVTARSYDDGPLPWFQEWGADAHLTWSWDPTTLTLDWNLTCNPGKIVGVGIGIDDDIFEPPNYGVIQGWYHGPTDLVSAFPIHPRLPECVIALNYLVVARGSLSSKIVAGEIGPSLGTITIGNAIYNDAIWPVDLVLRDLNGTEYAPQYLAPQYAIPPGNYIIDASMRIPPELGITPKNRMPIVWATGKGVYFDIKGMTVDEMKPFNFYIIAENPFAESSYSNLAHSPINKTITVNVATKTNYDWWGCFVLPKNLTVRTLTAYTRGVSYQLSKFYNYTETLVDDYNLVAVRIPPEIDGIDCTYTVFGDITGDGKVNIIDISTAAKAFGSDPNHPRWNPIADINYDFKVNILDISAIAKNFGKSI